MSAVKAVACGFMFSEYKGVSFDSFIPNSPLCSAVEIMGADLWVGMATLAQKTLRTKIQVCDVDSVERRCSVEKEELCLLFKDLN